MHMRLRNFKTSSQRSEKLEQVILKFQRTSGQTLVTLLGLTVPFILLYPQKVERLMVVQRSQKTTNKLLLILLFQMSVRQKSVYVCISIVVILVNPSHFKNIIMYNLLK